MKNRIVKILLSLMIVSLSTPITQVYGKELSINAGIMKEFNGILDRSIKNVDKNLYQKVYTTANVNVRKEPNTEAEILYVISFNKKIEIFDYDGEWAIIKLNNSNINYAYINKKYVAENRCKHKKFNLPDNNGFKSFMPYTSILDRSSLQYYLQQDYAYTGEFGIRQVNGRYCAAIGTAFEVSIGTYFDLILENDEIIPCIVADIKASEDTQLNNITTASNGCVSEFVVDLDSLCDETRKTGDISSCTEEWSYPVKIIKIYDKNILNQMEGK